MLVYGHKTGKSVRMMRLAAAGLATAAVCFAAGVLWHRSGCAAQGAAFLRSLPDRWEARSKAPELPVMRIRIKGQHVRKLEAQREHALSEGVLVAGDDDFVPAQIALDDRTVAVRLRLKGDLVDHLDTEKWSYRIKVKDGASIFGMRVFSLQHPKTRNWDGEWLFQHHLKSEGVLALRYRLVNVFLNGVAKGIYALEEHFSRELLESQSRRDGVIVKFDETGFWRRMAITRWWDHPWRLRPDDFRTERAEVFRPTRVSRSADLSAERLAALGLLRDWVDGERPLAQVFDLKRLARFLAGCELWSARHALYWNNLRLYFDPLVARFEPVCFDADVPREPLLELCTLGEPWVRQALSDPQLARVFVQELERMSDRAYLRRQRTDLAQGHGEFIAALRSEWVEFDPIDWHGFERKQEFIRRLLSLPNIALAFRRTKAAVHVTNTVSLPVEVIGFAVAGGARLSTEALPEVLPARKADGPPGFLRIALPEEAHRAASLFMLCRIVGSTRTHRLPVQVLPEISTHRSLRPVPLSLSELVKQHPFIELSGEMDAVHIRAGDWSVEEDLIIPEGLAVHVEPGVTLRFGADTVWVCRGPIYLRGTEEDPIRLMAAGDDWPGLLVEDASRSEWHYVEVRSTRGIRRDGWITTGGVTFYRSSVDMTNCRFRDHRGEDALNVVSGEITFTDGDFSDCVSDAFDGDYVTARFNRSTFRRIGGDALDVSGSLLVVRDAIFKDIGDKALSIGEDSRLQADSIAIFGARFGVVSKDLSQSVVKGVRIEGTQVCLAAYQKKDEFGPGRLEVTDVTFGSSGRRTWVQTGSRILVDGKPAAETDVDVDVSSIYSVPNQGR